MEITVQGTTSHYVCAKKKKFVCSLHKPCITYSSRFVRKSFELVKNATKNRKNADRRHVLRENPVHDFCRPGQQMMILVHFHFFLFCLDGWCGKSGFSKHFYKRWNFSSYFFSSSKQNSCFCFSLFAYSRELRGSKELPNEYRKKNSQLCVCLCVVWFTLHFLPTTNNRSRHMVKKKRRKKYAFDVTLFFSFFNHSLLWKPYTTFSRGREKEKKQQPVFSYEFIFFFSLFT